jgi:hypothetical protein
MSANHFRPLSLGEVLDGAFTLYRRHFADLATIAMLSYLPLVLVYVGAYAAGWGPESRGTVALFVYACTLAALACRPALVQMAAAAYLGQPTARADAWRVAARRSLKYVPTLLLGLIAITFGMFFLLVPGFLMMIMFFAVEQVVTLENTWGIAALVRSGTLAEGAWGRIFALGAVCGIMSYLPMIALYAGASLAVPGLFGQMMAGEITGGVALLQAGVALVSAVLQPLLVMAFTLQYFDRRIRTEALDLAPASAPSTPARAALA